MAGAETKTCLVCKQILSIESFTRDKNRKDGRYPYCRSCCSKQNAIRFGTPEFKARKKVYDRERYKANREAVLAYSKAAYAKNPEIVKERMRQWVVLNPERRKATVQSYKHRRRSQEQAGMSGPELREWKKAQKKVCHWCGIKCARRYTVDHVIPLAKGGKHEAHNLVIACRPCNGRKHARDPIEFARMMGKLL